ncbi:ankyrin, partial [Thozetella sp. PMI_491]
ITELWSQAFDALSNANRRILDFVHYDEPVEPSVILGLVAEERESCIQKQWVLYTNRKGEQVKLRSVLNSASGWVDQFLKIGDGAAQIDPCHAAIPWMVVKALLQVTINDCQTFGRMVETIENVSSIIAVYSELEARLLSRVSTLTERLSAAMLKLYTAVLQFLAKAYHYYHQSTLKRLFKSTVQPAKSAVDEPMLHIRDLETDVYRLANLASHENDNILLTEIINRIAEGSLGPTESTEVRRARLSSRIGGVDAKTTYDSALRDRHPGTCEWVLELDELCVWQRDGPPWAKLLWIHGPPGFGKTFLSAWITRYLEETSLVPVAYFFCAADLQTTRDPYSILRSWLTQVLEQDDEVLKVLESIFGTTNKDTILTHGELWDLFIAVGEAIPGCIFIVDGFDECTSIDSGTGYHRHDPRGYFLRDLVHALSKTRAKVLLVSRDVHDIRSYLSSDLGAAHEEYPGVEMLEYRITATDTVDDLQAFSQSMMNRKLPKKKEALRREIARQAAERSEGMFLWIKLLENEISPSKNAKQLAATVREMPAGIGEAYSRELERIFQLPAKARQQAVMILRWVLFAVSPLQVKELAEALLVSGDELEHYPRDELPDTWEDEFVDDDYVKESILGPCGSLLQLRPGSSPSPLSNHTVHFVHFSLAEYLSSSDDENPWANFTVFGDTVVEEGRLSRICLRYLALEVFQKAPEDTKFYPFLAYAAWAWYFHSFKINPAVAEDILEEMWKVFDPVISNWKVWGPVLEAEFSTSDRKQQGSADHKINEHDDSVSDQIEKMAIAPSPIYYASLLGLINVVKRLVARGLDVNCSGGQLGSPLQAAVSRCHLDVVRYLLDRQAQVTQTGGVFGTALIAAAALATPDMLQVLLDAGGDVFGTDETGLTALDHATRRGATDMVQQLLDSGAEVTPASRRLACQNGHKNVLLLLMKRGAVFDLVSDKEDVEAVSLAMNYSNALPVVQKLLCDPDRARRAEVNRPSKGGRIALQAAVCTMDLHLVETLLKAGADASYSHRHGGPIHMATAHKQKELIQMLYRYGADINQITPGSVDALSLAVLLGEPEVVSTILELGPRLSCHTRGSLETPFEVALRNNYMEIAEMLIRQGCFRANETGCGGGNCDKGERLATIVMQSCGSLEKVDRFLSRGLTQTTKDLDEALLAASCLGHASIVAHLLGLGANAKARDMIGRTPLHYAARLSHHTVVELLSQHSDDDAFVEDNFGSTPLNLAICSGKRASSFIVRRLGELQEVMSRETFLTDGTVCQVEQGCGSLKGMRETIIGTWKGEYEYKTWREGTREEFSMEFSSAATEMDILGRLWGTIWFAKLYEKQGWLYKGSIRTDAMVIEGSWGSSLRIRHGTFVLK